MKYNLFIDIVDNNDITKKISENLYNKLKQNNYNVTLLNNDLTINQKINRINQENDNVLVISNQMNNANTSEIIYSLYFNNILPSLIESELSNFLNISKYYQLRLPGDTSKDYYEIIRETPNAESIIIRYQNSIENQITNIVNKLYDSIIGYIEEENIYIVQKGDSLYSIARKYNITANDIIKANNLSNTNLSIGQELIIPEPKETVSNDYQKYIVKSGDSLYRIASTYNTTVDALKLLNNLTSNVLSIGQTILLPQTTSIPSTTIQYTVKSGDSLYKIASTYKTTVEALKAYNNLSSNILSIGQVLTIPKESSNNQRYTVKSGDSLYRIATTFNTSVEALKTLNKLTSNTLSIGQVLLIPNS